MKLRSIEPVKSCLTVAEFSPLPYQVDFTGFLSNTVAPCWLESLRVKMMAKHFSVLDVAQQKHLSVIVSTEISYVRPVRYGDLLEGQVWIAGGLRSSWKVAFCFVNKATSQQVICASQVGAFIHPVTMVPVRIPIIIQEILLSSTQESSYE